MTLVYLAFSVWMCTYKICMKVTKKMTALLTRWSLHASFVTLARNLTVITRTYSVKKADWLSIYVQIYTTEKKDIVQDIIKKKWIFSEYLNKCLFVKQKYLSGFWFRAASMFSYLCILISILSSFKHFTSYSSTLYIFLSSFNSVK